MMVLMVEEVVLVLELKVEMVLFVARENLEQEEVGLEVVAFVEVVAFARFHPPDYYYRKQS